MKSKDENDQDLVIVECSSSCEPGTVDCVRVLCPRHVDSIDLRVVRVEIKELLGVRHWKAVRDEPQELHHAIRNDENASVFCVDRATRKREGEGCLLELGHPLEVAETGCVRTHAESVVLVRDLGLSVGEAVERCLGAEEHRCRGCKKQHDAQDAGSKGHRLSSLECRGGLLLRPIETGEGGE